MAHMFGNTWTRQYGVDPAGSAAETWSAALAGLSAEKIARGLQETLARGLEWPPPAPRFRAMCMGIPSMAHIRHCMANPGDTPTPFLRQFWLYLNRAEYESGDEYRCERSLNEAYELLCEHVMLGKPLPASVAAVIEHKKRPKPVPASEETARRELDRIAAIFKSGEPAAGDVA